MKTKKKFETDQIRIAETMKPAADSLVIQALGGNVENLQFGASSDTNSEKKCSYTDVRKKEKKKIEKKIAISLKTKSLNTKSSNSEFSGVTENVTQVDTSSIYDKKMQKDMDKWVQRGREINETSTEIKSVTSEQEPKQDLESPQNISSSDTATIFQEKNHVTKIATTVKGLPICLLCRRKFASIQKLRQHEEVSALHKENLAKKAAIEIKRIDETNEQYRDRAKERRDLYGSEQSFTSSSNVDKSLEDVRLGASLMTKARTVTLTQTVKPDENLGNSNIGNKLLQKLGWKGGSLGRKNDGSSNHDITNVMKEDWEKIEALAKGTEKNS